MAVTTTGGVLNQKGGNEERDVFSKGDDGVVIDNRLLSRRLVGDGKDGGKRKHDG